MSGGAGRAGGCGSSTSVPAMVAATTAAATRAIRRPVERRARPGRGTANVREGFSTAADRIVAVVARTLASKSAHAAQMPRCRSSMVVSTSDNSPSILSEEASRAWSQATVRDPGVGLMLSLTSARVSS